MAIVVAVAAVVDNLVKLSALAKETRENIEEDWYQASKDMEEFLNLEKKLKRKSEDWKEALRSAGMSDDSRITEPLNEAIQSLEREKTKMETVQSNSCCVYRFKCLFMFRGQPFPSDVKDTVKKLVDAFDNIPNAFANRIEAAMLLEPLADNRLEPYQITVDPRIVKMAETQDEVMQILEDRTGNQVVTLFGLPGTGKTSLAQLVAQHYQAPENRAVFADGARFLPCGRDATVESICKQLFQTLGISDANTDSAPDAKAEHEAFKSKTTGASEGQASSMQPLVRKLPRRLKERHLLIILDDVSDPALLKDKLIVPLAKNVKYLITTQERNICDGAALIKMKKPKMEEAMSILGKHIPSLNSTNGVIPLNLEDMARRIVEKSDYQPMTLATIATQIVESESWEEVLENFNEVLSSEEMLALSLQKAVEALGNQPGAQKLLYLMAMCEPLSVPKVVLQLLFQHMDPQHVDSFTMKGKTLRDRGFIEVNEKDWILSSTYQYFILKNKQEDVSQLLHTLLTPENNDTDHELVKALCVLYIECKKSVPFTAPAADALESAAKEFKFSMKDRNMILSMREAVEPLIYLLFLSNEGEECDMRRHRLVSEAIKCFISNQDLDDKSFAQLLGEEDIFEDICRVLMKMTEIKYEPILTNDKTMIMDEFRSILVSYSKDDVITTLTTISLLAHEANCDFILAEDRILTTVLKILRASEDGYRLKMSALTCLSSLAQSSTAREKIASWEGLIEAVVAIFYMQSDITQPGSMYVKVLSIRALGHIADHEMTSVKLVKTPDLLNSIERFLIDIYSKDTEFILARGHSNARPTIQCLLSLLKGNDRNREDILRHIHLIDVVTNIFEKFNGDEVAHVALQVLTIIDPAKYNSVPLHSIDAFTSRGHSNAHCRRYVEAFDDYKRADRMDKSNDSFYKTKLCFFKAMVNDFKAALVYGGWALDEDPHDPFLLQEIGVVKELMGDYEGAKSDFDKSLEFGPDDYEVLKHRAYVNFKLGCEKEAHEDAQQALKVIPKYRVDKRDIGQAGCLGVLSVPKFLDYDLN